jgi:hypothetical protein
VEAKITLTGHAKTDFNFNSLSATDRLTWGYNNNSVDLAVPSYMSNLKRFSGFDLDGIFFQYDPVGDILNLGIHCKAICGDADGDGNPGSLDPNCGDACGQSDPPDMCYTEEMSIMMWPQPPADYVINPNDPTFFFPWMVVGVNYEYCLVDNTGQHLGAYQFTGYDSCLWPIPKTSPNAACVQTLSAEVGDPGSPGVYGNVLSFVSPHSFRPFDRYRFGVIRHDI